MYFKPYFVRIMQTYHTGSCQAALPLLKHLAEMSYRPKDLTRRALKEYLRGALQYTTFNCHISILCLHLNYLKIDDIFVTL